MKDIKEILRGLGFHFSYNCWVSDTDSRIKANIYSNRTRYCIELSQGGNLYLAQNRFWFARDEDRKHIELVLLERLLKWV